MTDNEKKLVSVLLNLAADEFANHGCNDFDLAKILPNVEDRRKLMQDMYTHNGDPENFDPNEEYRYTADFWLLGYFADKILETPSRPPPTSIPSDGRPIQQELPRKV